MQSQKLMNLLLGLRMRLRYPAVFFGSRVANIPALPDSHVAGAESPKTSDIDWSISEAKGCAACDPAEAVLQGQLAFAIYNRAPVTRGHMLLIPRRHVETWSEVTLGERHALLALADQAREKLYQQFGPDGFSLVVAAAEGAIRHVHLHLIPRFRRHVARHRTKSGSKAWAG
ncbi:MAG TPA: HIT family protein [Hyphomicrobiales bacterium]|nr:HIT family protein [Hyphomicrobiales bacterium]